MNCVSLICFFGRWSQRINEICTWCWFFENI